MFMAVIATMTFTVSCDDNLEETPQFKKSETALAATSSASTVAVTAEDSLDQVLTISWNDPAYAVGLENTKFTIMFGAQGQNFVRFYSKEYEGVLSGALTAQELNAIALKFGADVGEAIALEAKVVASQENNNEPKTSNVLPISVTPYGDLMITPSAEAVSLSATTPDAEAIELNWTTAFAGYDGVKTYQLQYAKTGTDFASPMTVDVNSLTRSFSHFDLNKIALGFGIAPLQEGDVDFRIKATNEAGNVIYSNVATVSVTPYVAYNAIGIIGDATAGGWDVDTDMYRPDPTKPTEWTVTAYLVGGKSLKFRAEDKWDNNWGAATFPTGTGTQNGPNIPVTNSGYYKITFNAGTGAYTFTTVTTTVYNFVSLIGEQSSWGSDIADLSKDPNNEHIWTGTVNLTAGQLKFRANHDWAVNWGATSDATATNLSGYGVQNGANVSITTAGNYFVYINTATGEYFFGKSDRATPYTDVGLIGDATPGGWDSDTNLIRNPSNPYKWSGYITLTNKEAKFRAQNDWGVNWGGSTFPTGVSTQNGPNIPIAAAGTYYITFNSSTGEYTFVK
jgi:hypothetical protein